jgi:hypothetical protein
MSLATPFVYTPATGDNSMDVIAHAAGALMAQGYSVDGVVMNANDYRSCAVIGKNAVKSASAKGYTSEQNRSDLNAQVLYRMGEVARQSGKFR